MAYGLDVTDLIYTDSNLYDLGTLEDYTVDLDIAKEKNFELEIGATVDFQRKIRKTIGGKIDLNNDISQLDLLVPIHGYWYIEGTEFGGVIDSFKTDNDNYSIKYTGRSWRGILASKVYVCPNSESDTLVGDLPDVINDIFTKYDLDYLFVCDPITDLDEQEEREVSFDAIQGTSIYDVITAMADTVHMALRYTYSNKDKKIHITPDFATDFTDEMTYDVDSSVKFSVSRDKTFVNHYVLTAKSDTEKNRYTIHVFLNEEGNYLPYLVDDVLEGTQIKDSQYILDTSKQVMKRTDEICEYIESNSNPVTNYERLVEKPSDWETNYKKYYTHKPTISETSGDETSEESAIQTETSGDSWTAVEMVTTDHYSPLYTQPPDWEYGYENYYTRSWSDARTTIKSQDAYIRFDPTTDENVVSTDAYYERITTDGRSGYFKVLNIDPNCNPKEKGYYEMATFHDILNSEDPNYMPPNGKNWLSDTDGGSPIANPQRSIVYIIRTFGDFYNDSYEWTIDDVEPKKSKYTESSKADKDPEWTYSPVSGVTRTNDEGWEQVKDRPVDWDLTFSQFNKRNVKTINNKQIVEWTPYSEVEATEPDAIQITQIDPETWKETYSDYYKRFATGISSPQWYYKQYEGIPEGTQDSQYTLVPSKPPNWDLIYDQYYYKVINYTGIPGKDTTTYESYSSLNDTTFILTTVRPKDWNITFGDYFTKVKTNTPTSIDEEYTSVQPLEFDNEKIQAFQKITGKLIPSAAAWKEHYSEYFKRITLKLKKKTGWVTAIRWVAYEGTESTKKPQYKQIKSKPKDWDTNYDDYFYGVETGRGIEYKQYETKSGIQTKKITTKRPTMWSTDFGSYYEKKGKKGQKKKFVNVEGVGANKNRAPRWRSGKYWQQVEKPRKNNVPDFGYIPNYKNASGKRVKCKVYYEITPDDYEIPPKMDKSNLWVETTGLAAYEIPGQKQFSKKWLSLKKNPKSASDALSPVHKGTYTINSNGELFGVTVYWNENKNSYYTLAPKWEPKKYYYQDSTESVPDFKSGNTYYKIRDEEMKAPAFDAANCWKLETKMLIPDFDPANCWLTVTDTTYPEFKPGIYYSKSTTSGAPPFEDETYYRRVFDHYKNMVDDCLKKIKESKTNESQEVTLDDYDLNIGDLVGGKDHITGLYVTRTITNIVVKIDKGEVYLDYTMDDDGELDAADDEQEET